MLPEMRFSGSMEMLIIAVAIGWVALMSLGIFLDHDLRTLIEKK